MFNNVQQVVIKCALCIIYTDTTTVDCIVIARDHYLEKSGCYIFAIKISPDLL